jgi:dipeptidyl aminopeptidase/acylaminoacyl peptidase
MPDKRVLPYGSWPTPITSAVVVANAVGLADVAADGRDVIWAEERPDEGGRTALVRRSEDGRLEELLAPEENARTAVHEYGGGAWWAEAGIVWFANWVDQRLYRRDPGAGRSEALTPSPGIPRGDRYADGALSPDRETIVCVREHHPPDGRGPIDVRNEIVRLAANEPSTPEVLVSGPDFVSSPGFSADANRLCWVEWDHPNMPWDATRLFVRDLQSGEQRLIAGGDSESVIQPQWQDDGSLTFISDRSGWWNLYRFNSAVEPLVEVEAEIGEPQWEFGQSRYAVLADGRVVFARMANGSDGLAIRLLDGTLADLGLPFTRLHNLTRYGDCSVVLIGATPTAEPAVVSVSFGADATIERVDTLRPPRDLRELGVDPETISAPEAIDYPSAGGRVAHAILYRPRNRDYRGADDELPPLLVHVHGGPTAESTPQLRLDLQYLTSRGLAVIDVNYGGSTGYGRAYRQLLNDNWGIVDVEDSIAAARYLVQRGEVDPRRLCVSGGSAGGYTTLACMARADTPFGAGGDYFGVADLEAMALETHKFESRYLDRLIGPYPEARATYRARSPIDHVDELLRPLIVLQGLEDEVVPPNQATMIVDALRSKGIPVAYLAFEGEQHGFRLAANIRRAIDSELSFYAQVFGFELPPEEGIEPVEVERP